MFIAALFTIAKIWKQPKCPSVDECVTQLWGIYTVEYYSTIKEENFTFCDNMDGPGEICAEISQSEQDKCRTISHVCGV